MTGVQTCALPIFIDNLGISAQQVQEEFQKTGDFAKAVGNIIDESMGGQLYTNAQGQDTNLSQQPNSYPPGLCRPWNGN